MDHTNQNKDDNNSDDAAFDVVEGVVWCLFNDGHVEETNGYQHQSCHCVGSPVGGRREGEGEGKREREIICFF